MSGGPRPPVPGLIPLAALSRRPGRPRRRPESIDAAAGSRGPETRATRRPRRHRHRKDTAVGKHGRSLSPALERPPRVNPIFVWVRQEDTRIVDVKCEDYDKRNRILLTKTAHGWRAIPRTETLAPQRASAETAPSCEHSQKTESTTQKQHHHNHHHHHHHHHHKRRSRKSKSNLKSSSSQTLESPSRSPHTSDCPLNSQTASSSINQEPSWLNPENVNIETLLPSHTIHVKRTASPEGSPRSVNSVNEFARAPLECSTPDKVCDVSPLDNLLAVAELELKQHIQSGNWITPASSPQVDELETKESIQDEDWNTHSSSLKIEEPEINRNVTYSDWNIRSPSPTMTNLKSKQNWSGDEQDPSSLTSNHHYDSMDDQMRNKEQKMQIEQIEISDDEQKSREDYYNDEDEMHEMSDILSKLEQSLESPQSFDTEKSNDEDGPEEELSEGKIQESTVECVSLHKYDTNNPEIHLNNKDSEMVDDTNLNQTVSEPECKDELYHENNNKVEPSSILPENSEDVCSIMEENTQTQPTDSNPIESTKENSNDHDTSENDDFELDNSKMDNMNMEKETDQDNVEIKSNEAMELDDQQDLEHVTAEKNVSECTEMYQDTTEINSDELKLNDSQISETISKEKTEEVLETKPLDPKIPLKLHIDDEPICLDLSIRKKLHLTIDTNTEDLISPELDGPTDLSIRKNQIFSKSEPPRPVSQSSEAIQSPQPSGIPAVPPSPDIVSTTCSTSKPRSIFLESLLVSSLQKVPLNSEVTIIKQKEPLDLGNCRKSASPTVTCSEEIIAPSNDLEQPPMKKLKSDDITLKTLLDKDIKKAKESVKHSSGPPETPRLLSLLKASAENSDPLTEFRQLLLEIDIPNPLMVPKESFADLLKYPRREILKILTGQTNRNVNLDDILVVYKDKLEAALESNIVSAPKMTENVKTPTKFTSRPNEKSLVLNGKPLTVSAKRKSIESNNKSSSAVETPAKNISANDIEAANEASMNSLLWSSYQNHVDAMANYSNHNEFIQALYAASMPFGMPGELHPSLQLMLGNKMPQSSLMGFPPVPPINFNNPLEMSLWQEAMMQASVLRNKNPYEGTILNQPSFRSNLEAKRSQMQQSHGNRHQSRMGTNGQSKSLQQSQPMQQQNQQMQQQALLQGLYGPSILNHQPGWQNPYLGLNNFQQSGNNLPLNVPQLNPYAQKAHLSPTSKQTQLSPSYLQKQNKESSLLAQFNEQEKLFHQQIMQEQKLQQIQQQKLMRHQQQHMSRHSNGTKQGHSPSGKISHAKNHFAFNEAAGHEKGSVDAQRHQGGLGPIDLSGPPNIKSKSKLLLSAMGKTGNSTVTSTKNHAEDVPEVGSTTTSIEDIQDVHAQLWHPLFGSHTKGYNPWQLPSLAATGE